jgi:Single-stranded DNA-specific exonuclease
VPLVDENRTLVKYGLKALRTGKRPGLRLLADKISLKLETIHSESVAYIIVPHINAAGRIGSPHWAVQLLTTANLDQQEQMAAELVQANRQRKDLQEKAFQRCLAVIQDQHQQDLFVILQAEGVHEGIAGIVAGKIKDRLNRPVVLVTDRWGT